MERTRDGSGYGATVKNRAEGPSAAGHLGAAALLIRSVGTSDQRHAHTGTTNYRVDAPRIPALALSNPTPISSRAGSSRASLCACE